MKKIKVAAILAMLTPAISCSNEEEPTNAPSAHYSYEYIYSLEDQSILVQFHNDSKNADAILWEFGDGTSSTEQNPVKKFEATGTYQVRLYAEFSSGHRFIDRQIYVAVGCTGQSAVEISTFPIDENFRHVGFDLKMDPNQSYRLSFGDGTSIDIPQNVETKMIGHTYNVPGSYCVSLVGLNGDCAAIILQLDPIFPG